jgi:hypothetical protein
MEEGLLMDGEYLGSLLARFWNNIDVVCTLGEGYGDKDMYPYLYMRLGDRGLQRGRD